MDGVAGLTRDDLAEAPSSLISAGQWGPGYRFWQGLLTLLAQRGPEGTTSLVRMASHLAIFIVAMSVLWFSRVQLPHLEIVEASAPPTPANIEAPLEAVVERQDIPGGALVRAALPFTLIPERSRLDIITHTVKAGDTLYGIAEQYGIDAETVMWANNMELNPDLLRLEQDLTILPVRGVYHTVDKGDTLDGIAKKYKANVADIVSFQLNSLNAKNPQISVGQKLVVPGGSKPAVVRYVQIYSGPIPAGATRGSGRFVWPAAGVITQGYLPLHTGIDVGAGTGAPVKASDSGYVIVAGWSEYGYGNHVVIDHGNGFQTLYAHLSRYFVNAGDQVGQGATIGLVGSTGRSTGPHLHFEIRQNGVLRNPFGFLP